MDSKPNYSQIKKITSLQHPLVKHLIKLRQNSDYRKECQTVCIVGYKTIKDLSSHLSILRCFIEEDRIFEHTPKAQETYLITPEISKKISGVVSPEGLIIETALPQYKDLSSKQRLLALDGISDPGNLGTLLRTALALGWEGVYLLPNCVDPFNDKCIRAAKGSSFFIPMMQGSHEEFKKFTTEHGFDVYRADLEGTPPESLSPGKKKILLLGAEGQGIHPSLKTIGHPISLPMTTTESLNVGVAGSIIMYLWREPQQKSDHHG